MKTTAKELYAIAIEINKRKAEEERAKTKAKDMKFVEDVIFPKLNKCAERGEFYTTIQFDTCPTSISDILHEHGFTTKTLNNNKLTIYWLSSGE